MSASNPYMTDESRARLAWIAARYQSDPPRDTPAICRCCWKDTTWGELRGDRYGQPTVGAYAFLITCPTTGMVRKVHRPECPCGRCAKAQEQREALMQRGWSGVGKPRLIGRYRRWGVAVPTLAQAFVYLKCGIINPRHSPAYAGQFGQRVRRLRQAGYEGPVEWHFTLEQSRAAYAKLDTRFK